MSAKAYPTASWEFLAASTKTMLMESSVSEGSLAQPDWQAPGPDQTALVEQIRSDEDRGWPHRKWKVQEVLETRDIFAHRSWGSMSG